MSNHHPEDPTTLPSLPEGYEYGNLGLDGESIEVCDLATGQVAAVYINALQEYDVGDGSLLATAILLGAVVVQEY